MNPIEEFERSVRDNIASLRNDPDLAAMARLFMRMTAPSGYTYNFRWMGRPIIQFPQDIMAMQELIWSYRPDAIIETGVAHGGSLVFYASMLELLGGDARVLGVDIDIRAHNRAEIEAHPMARRIRLLQGSSTAPETLEQVRAFTAGKQRVLVVLDSNHTHAHVLEELRLYAPLVRKGGYMVVFDTLVEDMPAGSFPDRPWDKGDNPKTAVWEFLRENERFEIDKDLEAKLLITVAPDGYLRCVKD